MLESFSKVGQCRRIRLPNAWSTQKLLVWLWDDYWQTIGTHVGETVRRRRRAIVRARRRSAICASLQPRGVTAESD